MTNRTPVPSSRTFEVRYGPEQPRSAREEWPNNLGLTGKGTLQVGADAVLVSDGRNRASARQRTFAMSAIGNVGHAEDSSGQIVALRTLADKREVLVWLASREEAQALLQLLPKVTTPEFLARQQQYRKFHDNLARLAPRARVTPALIAVNVAIFLLLVALGAGFVSTSGTVEARFGSNLGPLTWNGQPWRLLTAAFIHFGVVHLAVNMYSLYNVGMLTERLFGSARFTVIYLLAALAGNVASGWWDAANNSAGASGAIFGVFGALLVFVWRRARDLPPDLLKGVRSSAALLLLYSVAMGYAMPFIDNAAHVGGLLGGALCGLLLVRPFEPEARAVARPWRVLAVAAGGCALLVALSLALIRAHSGIR